MKGQVVHLGHLHILLDVPEVVEPYLGRTLVDGECLSSVQLAINELGQDFVTDIKHVFGLLLLLDHVQSVRRVQLNLEVLELIEVLHRNHAEVF